VSKVVQSTTQICYHCGAECESETIVLKTHRFCCQGCASVFQILEGAGLADFYELEKNPGTRVNPKSKEKFHYLDNVEIQNKLLTFNENAIQQVQLDLPQIHCSSCLWLLENLPSLHDGIRNCVVHFSKKQATITYSSELLSLRELVELLAKIGYEPTITWDHQYQRAQQSDSGLLYRIAVAGFCFGNIMLFSFPEYLSSDLETKFGSYFAWICAMLILPVMFYAGLPYLVSAGKSLNNKRINMDVPIALGMVALFLRSFADLIMDVGPGYFDSLAGLIFFLLIGRWFQNRTYKALSFDRDYKSYFPIGVTLLEGEIEKTIPLDQVKVGDVLLIRDGELLPADASLLAQDALMNYQFVTGEQTLIPKTQGEYLYSGGKVSGNAAEVLIEKEVDQSYLTQLWNLSEQPGQKKVDPESKIDKVSRVFTWIVLGIALVAGLFWAVYDATQIWFVISSVLIVACPCALALTRPFAFGSAMRYLSKTGYYIKNGSVLDHLDEIRTWVFDKTGTITGQDIGEVKYHGEQFTASEIGALMALAHESSHPFSKRLYAYVNQGGTEQIANFSVEKGKGVSARWKGKEIRIGSTAFVGLDSLQASTEKPKGSGVGVRVNDKVGYFEFKEQFREGMEGMLSVLGRSKDLYLLSGDPNGEKKNYNHLFPAENMLFNQSPEDKLNWVKRFQEESAGVGFIGDGLNDSGALREAKVGIAVADDVYQFSPACDVIVQGNKLASFPQMLQFVHNLGKLIQYSYLVSILYNSVGVCFAVSGMLSPIVAAILMPLSSITVVGFVTGGVRILARSKS